MAASMPRPSKIDDFLTHLVHCQRRQAVTVSILRAAAHLAARDLHAISEIEIEQMRNHEIDCRYDLRTRFFASDIRFSIAGKGLEREGAMAGSEGRREKTRGNGSCKSREKRLRTQIK